MISLYQTYSTESKKQKINLIVNDISSTPSFEFNLNINSNKSLQIRSQDLDLTLSSDLNLQGNNLKPNISGYISIDQGSLFFQRDFQITRGEIYLSDPSDFNPELDILASADIPPYKVTTQIYGKSKSPNVEFSVTPQTKDDGKAITMTDILFLISKGYIPNHEGQLDEVSSLLLSEVGSTVWKNLPFDYLVDSVAKDIINIYPDVTTDENGLQVPRINSSVKVPWLKNVEFFLRRTPDQTEASIEMPIHTHVTLSGKGKKQSSNQGDQDISIQDNEDLDFNIRFRFPFE